MADFKPGDIIQGTEGNGKTWANTTILLLVRVHDTRRSYGPDASAIVLKSFNPLSGEMVSRHDEGLISTWGLGAREWEKIGEVPEVTLAAMDIEAAVAAWKEVEHG